jgi:hypothetical protein
MRAVYIRPLEWVEVKRLFITGPTADPLCPRTNQPRRKIDDVRNEVRELKENNPRDVGVPPKIDERT